MIITVTASNGAIFLVDDTIIAFDPVLVETTLSAAPSGTLQLPPALVTPMAQFQSDVNAALAAAGGVVARISAADAATIYADGLAVEAVVAGLEDDPNALVASPAIDAGIRAAAINNTIIVTPLAVSRILHAVNPNMFALAGQYLNDPTRWQDITTASKMPPDPQPIGIFTVTIPAS